MNLRFPFRGHAGCRRRGWLAALLALPAVLALSGCQPEKGEVAGKVVYDRQPLTHGTVMFFCQDQQIISRLITPDGTYSVPDLPLGPAKVVVVTHPPIPEGYQRPQKLPPSRDAPNLGEPARSQLPFGARYVPIPHRYSDPDQSGLAVTVARGSQTFDITLDPETGRSR
jgi:hypothetical protein